jgi:hypothetical protein
MGYNPNQPRDPAGSPTGGQWTSGMSIKSPVELRNTPQTQTEEFKRWFAGSMVVDAKGKPLMVYRGDRPGKTQFTGLEDKSNYIQGNVFFADDARIGRFYTRYRTNYMMNPDTMTEEHGLYRAYLSIKNPLVVNAGGEDWSSIPNPVAKEFSGSKNYWGKTIQVDDLAVAARKLGYDGLIVRNVFDQAGTSNQYVAFRPDQIRLARSSESFSSSPKYKANH